MTKKLTRSELLKGAGAAALLALAGASLDEREQAPPVHNVNGSIAFSTDDGETWHDLGASILPPEQVECGSLIYVDPGVTSGDGQSPGTAFGTIQEALAARGGDVLVIHGTFQEYPIDRKE